MPEPDYFLRYHALQRTECYYVGKIPRTGIERGYSLLAAALTRGFEASKDRCRR